jgi:hypothetical protein
MIDGKSFGESTVAPFNQRWEIEMRDINSADGGTAWTAFKSDDPDIQPGLVASYGDGFQAIVTNGGVYLEGHEIKVVAYDAAGNSAASEPIRVYVRHKKQ